MFGLVAVTVFAVGGVFGVPAAVSSPDYPANQLNQPHQYVDAHLLALATASDAGASTTTTTAPPATTTTTTPAPTPAPTPAVLASTPVASTAPTPAPTPAPAPPPVPAVPAVPAIGQATAWGCSAALAYLQTYAAPGFTLDCPGYAEGHEAMTCLYDTPAYPDACPNGHTIAISDPCPQAYMNESANSWTLTGQLSTEQQKFGVSYADIDPFGPCP
jgi:hypothetical protein